MYADNSMTDATITQSLDSLIHEMARLRTAASGYCVESERLRRVIGRTVSVVSSLHRSYLGLLKNDRPSTTGEPELSNVPK